MEKRRNDKVLKWYEDMFTVYHIRNFFTFEASKRYPNYGTKYENCFCKFLILLFKEAWNTLKKLF